MAGTQQALINVGWRHKSLNARDGKARKSERSRRNKKKKENEEKQGGIKEVDLNSLTFFPSPIHCSPFLPVVQPF